MLSTLYKRLILRLNEKYSLNHMLSFISFSHITFSISAWDLRPTRVGGIRVHQTRCTIARCQLTLPPRLYIDFDWNVNDLLRRHRIARIASYARLSSDCKRNRCLELRYWYVIETCACVIWNKRLFPQRKKIKRRLKSLQKIKKNRAFHPQQMFSMKWKESFISLYFYIYMW